MCLNCHIRPYRPNEKEKGRVEGGPRGRLQSRPITAAAREEREAAAATDTAAFDSLACARRQLSQPTPSQDITPQSFKRS